MCSVILWHCAYKGLKAPINSFWHCHITRMLHSAWAPPQSYNHLPLSTTTLNFTI